MISTHDGGVEPGEHVAGFLVLYGYHDHILPVHAGGGVESCLQNLIQNLVGDALFRILADGPPGEQIVHGFVHGKTSCFFFDYIL